jgi:hypothetical protein
MDTDSLFVKNEFSHDLLDDYKLGKWKLECRIQKAFFIQPKTYMYLKQGDKEYVCRCKGVRHLCQDDFPPLIMDKKIDITNKNVFKRRIEDVSVLDQ